MKTFTIMMAMIAAALIGLGSSVWAHEECDDEPGVKPHVTQPAPINSTSKPASSQVTIKLFQFQPGRTEVRRGTTVTWINDDEIYHSVTADRSAFAGALDGKGKSFSFTFTEPGLYTYYCDRHEHMRGEIALQ
jgi:plastocyanin